MRKVRGQGTDWHPLGTRMENYNVFARSQLLFRQEVVMQKRLRRVLQASLLASALAVAGGSLAWGPNNQPGGGSMRQGGKGAPNFNVGYFDVDDSNAISLSGDCGKVNADFGFC